jgi:uncharacterized protein YukE
MASSQVIVDPKEVREFTAKLNSFNAKLQGDFAALHAHFKRLGETWRDQEQERFAAEFDQTSKSIRLFLEAARRYIPFLIGKAEAAEAYLRRGRY